jgi:arylsulfatase A-like enzyme
MIDNGDKFPLSLVNYQLSINKMNKLLLTSLMGASMLSCTTKQTEKKPNIILILADDLGYGDLGYTGCKDFTTPNIDKLAKNGVEFTNGYASHPFCAPTRAGIMTGRYQHRFGFQENPSHKFDNHGIPSSETILPKLLKKANYKSALVGKWHLGVKDHHNPMTKGFDEFYGFVSGGHDYFKANLNEISGHSYLSPININGKPSKFDGYLTDVLTDYGLNFIKENKKNPFFLFMSYNAPHTPLHPSKKYYDQLSHIKNKQRRIYASMVCSLDEGVGRIVKELEESGIDENTLICFMSDNGGAPFPWPNNAPFNGSKGTAMEGGIHVPYLFYWKGKLQPAQYHENVISFDIFSTALELAGLEIPKDKKIDSKNLMPYLTGENSNKPHKNLYWMLGDLQKAVKSGNKKLIKIGDEKPLLFDIEKDIKETIDISQQNKTMSNDLMESFNNWKSSLPEPKYKSDGIANKKQQKYMDYLRNL